MEGGNKRLVGEVVSPDCSSVAMVALAVCPLRAGEAHTYLARPHDQRGRLTKGAHTAEEGDRLHGAGRGAGTTTESPHISPHLHTFRKSLRRSPMAQLTPGS